MTPAIVDDLMGIVKPENLYQAKAKEKTGDYEKYITHFRYLDDVTVLQPKTEHRYSLIWIHEADGNVKDHTKLFTDYLDLPDGCRVILPLAKKRVITSIAVDVNTWYDIKTATWPKHMPVNDEVLKNKFD